jgi:formylmethanofuran dehydrogenase subunit D
MGPWANQVVNPDSQSCGTPTYKGMKASVEVIPNGKVLDALNLISMLKEA